MSHASVLVALDAPQRRPVETLVQEQMAPFDENGEWFREGSRWDWWQIGGRFSGLMCDEDVILRQDVDLTLLEMQSRQRFTGYYTDAQAELKRNPTFPIKLIYGLDPRKESLEQYLARKMGEGEAGFPTHFAFLHNFQWHENGQLGWFGCDRNDSTGDKEVFVAEKPVKTQTPKVITYHGPELEWGQKFYERFVKPLPPKTLLVTVDYHV